MYQPIIYYYLRMDAAAVNNASVEEFNAVSVESCNTPIIKPTPTTCMAMSFDIPNKPHASGINNKEPPATPDAPHAQTAATILSSKAVGISTLIPRVLTAVKVNTVMVIAAPAMLIVAPRGIEIEYVSLFSPKRSSLH